MVQSLVLVPPVCSMLLRCYSSHIIIIILIIIIVPLIFLRHCIPDLHNAALAARSLEHKHARHVFKHGITHALSFQGMPVILACWCFVQGAQLLRVDAAAHSHQHMHGALCMLRCILPRYTMLAPLVLRLSHLQLRNTTLCPKLHDSATAGCGAGLRSCGSIHVCVPAMPA